MALVFVPDREALFLWGTDVASRSLSFLWLGATSISANLVTPTGLRLVPGAELPLLATAERLAAVPAAELAGLPASVACWALASKLAVELAVRGRLVPTVRRSDGRVEARWAAALSSSDDAAKVAALARSMPPAAHAVPVTVGAERDVWAPDALLRAYLDAVVDALAREARGAPGLPVVAKAGRRAAGPAAGAPWHERWVAALTGPQRGFEAEGFAERSVVAELTRWSEGALGKAIEDPYAVFKQLKQVSMDIRTDMNYPNQMRPDENPGYKTTYKP